MTYKETVLLNFNLFDKFLSKYQSSDCYNIFLSIRTDYCVSTYFKYKRVFLLKRLFKDILYLFSMPFLISYFPKKELKIILGVSTKHNHALSDLLRIPCLYPKLKIKFSPKAFKWFFLYVKIIKYGYLFLKAKEFKKNNTSYFIHVLIKAVIYYYKTDFSGIDTLITEDDTGCSSASIVLKAKLLNLKTIKIEKFLIDPINHNNVACEYYFCPNNFYKKIREGSPLNNRLNYLSGGFLNWDKLAEHQHQPLSNPKLITFFTQHSDHLKSKNEVFYIDEILSVIPSGFKLVIKIHPFEKIDKYEKYKMNPSCKIIMFGEIDNYVLISQSTFCFSIFSVLSFEAKHIMDHSFFINYEPDHPNHTLDYNEFNQFFDLIKNKEELARVLNGIMKPTTKELFILHFNPYFPFTKNKFLDFIK